MSFSAIYAGSHYGSVEYAMRGPVTFPNGFTETASCTDAQAVMTAFSQPFAESVSAGDGQASTARLFCAFTEAAVLSDAVVNGAVSQAATAPLTIFPVLSENRTFAVKDTYSFRA